MKFLKNAGLVARAAEFARVAHAGQKRKYTGEPYFNHVAEVAKLVAGAPGADEAMVAAAYLHDVIEDTTTTRADLEAMFGADVATLVDAVTDKSIRSDGNRKARRAIDRAALARAPERARTIKLADLVSNTATIAAFDPKFAAVYLEEKRLLLAEMTGGDPGLRARAMRNL